jgi:hypothetical protein
MTRESFSHFYCLGRKYSNKQNPSSCTLRLRLNHYLLVPPPTSHTTRARLTINQAQKPPPNPDRHLKLVPGQRAWEAWG